MIKDTLGMIYTGEDSYHLRDLCSKRPIAAIPIWGRYRAIDFLLTNLVNSGVGNVGVIAQQNYNSLMDHLGSGKAWDLDRKRYGLRILPPYIDSSSSSTGYTGIVDALQRTMTYIRHAPQRYVILSGSSVLFKSTFDEALAQHVATNADITVFYKDATPAEMSAMVDGDFIQLREDNRIWDFEINPASPHSNQVMMNVFILEKSLLEYLIGEAFAHNEHSFTEGILMKRVKDLRLYGYDYKGYVARLDSVQSYFKHSMKILEPEMRQEIFYESGSVYTKVKDEVPTRYENGSHVSNSMIADGCVIEGSVEDSILFRSVHIAPGAVVKNCVIMQGSEIQSGAVLENVVIDKSAIIRRDRHLVGQENYPVLIGKNAIV